MKILGIYFTDDWRKKQELNFDAILTSLSKTLNNWQWRIIVKTFAIPKFMFRASIIPLNKDILKQANSIIYKFVWKSKDKIKRLALSVPFYKFRPNSGTSRKIDFAHILHRDRS